MSAFPTRRNTVHPVLRRLEWPDAAARVSRPQRADSRVARPRAPEPSPVAQSGRANGQWEAPPKALVGSS